MRRDETIYAGFCPYNCIKRQDCEAKVRKKNQTRFIRLKVGIINAQKDLIVHKNGSVVHLLA